jgi:hypothetical protein
MKILYYSSAVSGSGHIVQGISIFNALIRRNIDASFLLLHNSSMGHLADRLSVPQRKLDFEDENTLSPARFTDSQLFSAITEFDPDIILVDLSWFMLHAFIDTLRAKKIFLSRQIAPETFTIPLAEGAISFNTGSYDLLVQTEPWSPPFIMEQINPLVIRDRDEILPAKEGRDRLEVKEEKPVCLFAINGNPGDFKRISRTYSYLEDEGYAVIYTTNYRNHAPSDLFPAVDYFNAVDFLICGAGYNAFWEARYFEKEALFLPIATRFENQYRRVEELSNHSFDSNGADQLVDMLLQL